MVENDTETGTAGDINSGNVPLSPEEKSAIEKIGEKVKRGEVRKDKIQPVKRRTLLERILVQLGKLKG